MRKSASFVILPASCQPQILADSKWELMILLLNLFHKQIMSHSFLDNAIELAQDPGRLRFRTSPMRLI